MSSPEVASDDQPINRVKALVNGDGSNFMVDEDLEHGSDTPSKAPSWDYPVQTPSYGMSDNAPELCSCCYIRKIGRFYVCCERQGPPQYQGLKTPTCMVGPCWPMVIFTSSLIIGACVAVGLGFTSALHWTIWIPIGGVLILMLTTYYCTACGNPGIQPRFSTAQGPNWMYYEKVDSFRPPGTTFCSESQTLVKRIDHFCPWTGTTIAQGNLKCFYAFTSSLCVGFIVLGVICVIGVARLGKGESG